MTTAPKRANTLPPTMAVAGVFGLAHTNRDINPDMRSRKLIKTTPIPTINTPIVITPHPAFTGLPPARVVEPRSGTQTAKPTDGESRRHPCEWELAARKLGVHSGRVCRSVALSHVIVDYSCLGPECNYDVRSLPSHPTSSLRLFHWVITVVKTTDSSHRRHLCRNACSPRQLLRQERSTLRHRQ
jgi:hypothetical protein